MNNPIGLPVDLEEHFKAFLKIAPDAIVITDISGNIVMCNKVTREIFGFEEQELVGKNIDILIPKQLKLSHHIKLNEYRSSLEQHKAASAGLFYGSTRSGSEVLIEINISPIETTTGIFMVSIIRNVAESVKIAQQIKDSLQEKEVQLQEKITLLQEKEFLLKEIKNPNVAIVLRNITGSLVPNLATLVLLNIFDESSNDLLLVVAEGFPEVDHTLQKYQNQLRKHFIKNPFSESFVKGLKSSQLYETLESIKGIEAVKHDPVLEKIFDDLAINSGILVPFQMTSGKNFGFLLCLMSSKFGRTYTLRDLEFIKEYSHLCALALESAKLVKKLEKSIKVRDDFLSIASHELKTPLTTLKLQHQILQRNLVKKNTDQLLLTLEKGLDLSLRQINILTKLVDDLLDVSRIRAEKIDLSFAKFNLSELLNEILQKYKPQLESAKNILSIEIEQNIEGVWDSYRMEQVITNILNNAIKHAPGSKVTVKAYKKKDRAIISISDTGPGIDILLQKKIFNRFERANASRNIGGLGLGLFIAKKIVEAHQGKIKLESRLGHGANFLIELPLFLTEEDSVYKNKEIDIG